jgi:predicted RNA-binding protein with PIN domain
LVFSKLGEKADEVIKRLAKGKGTGAIVVTSDREVSRYAERIAVPVISSDQFKERIEISAVRIGKDLEQDEEEGWGLKRKGPSRRLSKKERRTRAALKKL